MSAPSRAINVASLSVGSARANKPNCSTRAFGHIHADRDAIDGGGRRVRFEIEQRERPEHACIAHGRGQLHRPLVHVARHELQPGVQRHHAAILALETIAERLEQPRQHERQRLEPVDGPLEIQRCLEGFCRYGRHQGTRLLAARPTLPSQTVLSEPGGKIGGGKRGKIAESAKTPALELIDFGLWAPGFRLVVLEPEV